jgi:hypothetical protein
MELIKKVMPRDYVLIDSSDYHYGSANCARDSIKEMINKVASRKDYFLVNKGDSIEAILPNDKRYASCSLDIKDNLMTPIQQADAVVKDFMPIRDKIVGWGFGNHEYKLLNTMDFGRYIANQLDVPYGTYAFKFTAVDKKNQLMHKMFFTHGYGNINSNAKDDIQRLANKKASLKNKMCKSGFSDCIYMSCGHTHQLIVVDPTIEDKLFLTDDGVSIKQHYHVLTEQNADYIPPDSRWYGCSGSFLKLYSDPGTYAISYAEVAGYEPSEIGWIETHVQDGRVVAVEKVVA